MQEKKSFFQNPIQNYFLQKVSQLFPGTGTHHFLSACFMSSMGFMGYMRHNILFVDLIFSGKEWENVDMCNMKFMAQWKERLIRSQKMYQNPLPHGQAEELLFYTFYILGFHS